MISSEDAIKKPLPAPDADSAAFWRGLHDGKLLLQTSSNAPTKPCSFRLW